MLHQRGARRFHRQIGGGHVGRGDVPLPDSGAIQNPSIIGVHHLFEILIGQHSGRRVAAEGADNDS